jgi:hypothetical protein
MVARKPGALRNGAPFKDWVLPAAIERVRRKLAGADDGNRQMVNILTAVLTDGLPAVEAACAEALAEGVHSADVILNILARRRDPIPAVRILTPDALRLQHEPAADCVRYDSLRRAGLMERTEILDPMGELKLFGMRGAFDEVMANGLKRRHEPQQIIGELLKAEVAEKEARHCQAATRQGLQTSTSRARQSMRHWSAILQPAASSPSSAMSSWSAGTGSGKTHKDPSGNRDRALLHSQRRTRPFL